MTYRKTMEIALGRKLQSHEHVHHRDHNRAHNDLSNLEHCPTPKDHFAEHAWSDDDLIQWLVQYVDEFGRFPTSRQCNKHPGIPSATTFARHFGSWSRALIVAQDRIDQLNYIHGGYIDDDF